MTSATDNRTTELREKLTERGIEYTTNDHIGVCETSWNGFTAMQLTPGAKLIMAVTPEQAIAATLGGLTYEDYNILLDELGVSERTCHIEEYDDAPYPVCSECGAVQPEDFTVYYCWNCGAKVVNK